MNIPHIKECSSLSSVVSVEGCFCLICTWSFTLCKNDLDPNDNYDSVSSSSITNWCARCEQTTGLSVLSYFSVCRLRGVWLSCLVFLGLSDAVEASTSGVLSLHRETKFIIGVDFAVTLSSPDSFLCSFWHHFRKLCRTEMADVKQTQKMIPLVTCEVSLGQHVCELVFGVNVFVLDFGVQIDSIEQPIKSNSVGSVSVDFESSRSAAKSESWNWNSPSLHCLAVSPTWQYCLSSQVWWIFEINRFRRLSQALVHFVMDRASLFTDHRISGRPIRAKYKHFRTIWEHTCDNSPTDLNSSSLKWWSSMHGVDTL